MMRILPTLILKIAVATFFAVCWPCQAADYLQYPGNGFPHLSKNKPINGLNDEVKRYATPYSQITFSQGRMNFKDISGFKFVSMRRLRGPVYCFHVPLSISSGSCSIGIGGVRYLIDHKGFRVIENRKVIFESKEEKPIDIIVEVYSRTNSSTRFYDNEKLMAIVNAVFAEPDSISISLDNKSTGWIGPWEWLRGYE